MPSVVLLVALLATSPASERVAKGEDASSAGSAPTVVPYGFVRLDAIYDDSRMQHPQSAMWVLSEDGTNVPRDDAQMNLTPRLSRFGLRLTPVALGQDATARGTLEIDFQNGGSESRPALRMRHAFVSLDWGHLSVLVGQTWDLISPLLPAAHADALLWNVGNTGDRRPQVRAGWSQPLGPVTVDLTAAAAMTGAVDSKDLDADGEIDGLEAQSPGLQGRLGVQYALESGTVTLGAWGAWAAEDTSTAIAGVRTHRTSLVGFDATVPVGGAVLVQAEGWMGENLSDLRGGIGQGINAAGDEIRSRGGWAQIVVDPNPVLSLAAGAAVDHPEKDDIDDGGRLENTAGFAVITVRPVERLILGFEYLRWRTRYAAAKDGGANRFNANVRFVF